MRSSLRAGALLTIALLTASLMAVAFQSIGTALAQGEIIQTLAGGGPDGLPATSISLGPSAVLPDPTGGFYLAAWDWNYHAWIYRVDPNGILTHVAGTGVNGVPGKYGEGGPAKDARLAVVFALVLDPAGNLFSADTSAQRIRRIDGATATFTTVAGSVGGLPFGLARSATGHLYVSSRTNHWVLRIDAVTGIQSTLAGTGVAGFSGDGGPAAAAQLSSPCAIAFDASGNLFIADTGNRRIRKVDALTGDITTFAGTGNPGFQGDGGPATSANFFMPSSVGVGMTVDAAGSLYIADWEESGDGPQGVRIRRVDGATGVITLYAGAGSASGDGIPAIGASIQEPVGLAVDAAGDLLIADEGNTTAGGWGTVRKVVASSGLIYTLAGTLSPTTNGDGGQATSAVLHFVSGVATDAAGNVILAEDFGLVRRVDAATGTISLVAGGDGCSNGDGIPASSACLGWPEGVTLDPSDNLYIADSLDHRIRRVDAGTGIITTYAGNGTAGSGGDGMKATMANLNAPNDVAVRADGTLFIADKFNHKIRAVNPVNGKINTFAGNGTAGFGGDGGPALGAMLRSPHAVALDGAGNVFIADTENFRIRRVDAVTGVITTVAGSGTSGYGGDGGPATSASFRRVESMDVDADGNLLLADRTDHRIRKVDMSTGLIDTVVGTGVRAFAGDGGDPKLAVLNTPVGVAVEASGGFVIGDNSRIRRISPTSVPTEAGEVEDGNPSSETPLSIAKAPLGMITLSWGSSCSASDTDFEVYEGMMGSFASHAPKSCGTGGATSLTLTPIAGSAYYLVVPRSYAREGSYGLDGGGLERPASLTACIPQEIAACP